MCCRLIALRGHMLELHMLRDLPVAIAEKRTASPCKAIRQISGSDPSMRIGHELGSQQMHRINIWQPREMREREAATAGYGEIAVYGSKLTLSITGSNSLVIGADQTV